MSNKLQELTDRLYNEGLSKGKQEGAEIVKKAETESGRILSEAQRKAEDIVASARKEAEQIIKKAESDIRTAVSQSLSSTRQQIENMIVAEAAGKAPEELVSNEDFVKKMIESIVAAFNPAGSEPVDLDFVLPESLKAGIGPYLHGVIDRKFKNEIHVSYSDKFKGGFTVGPRGQGYFISFTDEEFERLISEHLRPAARKLLFG